MEEEDNEEAEEEGHDEESLEIFVDENGNSYSWNKLTGESKWIE